MKRVVHVLDPASRNILIRSGVRVGLGPQNIISQAAVKAKRRTNAYNRLKNYASSIEGRRILNTNQKVFNNFRRNLNLSRSQLIQLYRFIHRISVPRMKGNLYNRDFIMYLTRLARSGQHVHYPRNFNIPENGSSLTFKLPWYHLLSHYTR